MQVGDTHRVCVSPAGIPTSVGESISTPKATHVSGVEYIVPLCGYVLEMSGSRRHVSVLIRLDAHCWRLPL